MRGISICFLYTPFPTITHSLPLHSECHIIAIPHNLLSYVKDKEERGNSRSTGLVPYAITFNSLPSSPLTSRYSSTPPPFHLNLPLKLLKIKEKEVILGLQT